jgi:hypothetical protein
MSLMQRCQNLKEAAKLTLDEIEGFEQLSEKVLAQVVLEAIRTYQQKVAVGIEDSASDLLDTFKKNVVKQIFETAAGWRAIQRDNFLYPRGCRFCFQKANNTIVVIEQDPQVRTLSFMRGMQDDDQELSRTTNSDRLTISIPYTIFVFTFKDDAILKDPKFVGVRCYWRTSPLKTLNDNLHNCVLPNIHIGGMVCLGSVHSGPISEVCESVIQSFWTSQFNLDLADEWWHKPRISPTIETGRRWQDATREDPLFILRVPFRVHKPLKEVVEVLGDGETTSDSVFRHKVTEDIDACVNSLFHKICSYLKKTKFEKHSPKDISESLRKHMKSSVEELVDIVVALQHEINNISIESEGDKKIKQSGFFWTQRKL